MAYFTTYEILKDGGIKVGCSPSMSSFCAGGVAGLIYWITIFPVDVVKSCIQTDHILPHKRTYPSIWSAFKAIFKVNYKFKLKYLLMKIFVL